MAIRFWARWGLKQLICMTLIFTTLFLLNTASIFTTCRQKETKRALNTSCISAQGDQNPVYNPNHLQKLILFSLFYRLSTQKFHEFDQNLSINFFGHPPHTHIHNTHAQKPYQWDRITTLSGIKTKHTLIFLSYVLHKHYPSKPIINTVVFLNSKLLLNSFVFYRKVVQINTVLTNQQVSCFELYTLARHHLHWEPLAMSHPSNSKQQHLLNDVWKWWPKSNVKIILWPWYSEVCRQESM